MCGVGTFWSCFFFPRELLNCGPLSKIFWEWRHWTSLHLQGKFQLHSDNLAHWPIVLLGFSWGLQAAKDWLITKRGWTMEQVRSQPTWKSWEILRFFMIFSIAGAVPPQCRFQPLCDESRAPGLDCGWKGRWFQNDHWSMYCKFRSARLCLVTNFDDAMWVKGSPFIQKTLAMTVARGRQGNIMSYHDHLLHFCVLHSMSMIDIAWRYRYDMSAGKHDGFIRTQYSSAAQVFHTGSHTGGSNSPNNFLEKADQCETSATQFSKGSKDLFFLMSFPWYLGSKLQNILKTMFGAPVALGGQSPARAGSCFTRAWWFLSWTMKSREGDLRGKAAFQENMTFQWLKEFVNVHYVHSLPFLGKFCPDFQIWVEITNFYVWSQQALQ